MPGMPSSYGSEHKGRGEEATQNYRNNFDMIFGTTGGRKEIDEEVLINGAHVMDAVIKEKPNGGKKARKTS